MKTKYKYIEFVQVNQGWWICNNKKSHIPIGDINFYKPWKQWVMAFEVGAIFSSDCLTDIAHFLGQLNEQSKAATHD